MRVRQTPWSARYDATASARDCPSVTLLSRGRLAGQRDRRRLSFLPLKGPELKHVASASSEAVVERHELRRVELEVGVRVRDVAVTQDLGRDGHVGSGGGVRDDACRRLHVRPGRRRIRGLRRPGLCSSRLSAASAEEEAEPEGTEDSNDGEKWIA